MKYFNVVWGLINAGSFLAVVWLSPTGQEQSSSAISITPESTNSVLEQPQLDLQSEVIQPASNRENEDHSGLIPDGWYPVPVSRVRGTNILFDPTGQFLTKSAIEEFTNSVLEKNALEANLENLLDQIKTLEMAHTEESAFDGGTSFRIRPHPDEFTQAAEEFFQGCEQILGNERGANFASLAQHDALFAHGGNCERTVSLSKTRSFPMFTFQIDGGPSASYPIRKENIAEDVPNLLRYSHLISAHLDE